MSTPLICCSSVFKALQKVCVSPSSSKVSLCLSSDVTLNSIFSGILKAIYKCYGGGFCRGYFRKWLNRFASRHFCYGFCNVIRQSAF